jgi:TRAP-type C4-dicarboxylate transport system permease large subunit
VTRIPRGLGAWITDLNVAPFVVILIIFVIYFALGAMMDEIAILVIMTPMMYPIVIGLGYDGVWFGVVSIMMLLSGLITPPVGLITFVVSGITGISVGRVFRSIGPFLIGMTIAVLLVVAFPQIVLVLPELMN